MSVTNQKADILISDSKTTHPQTKNYLQFGKWQKDIMKSEFIDECIKENRLLEL